MSNPNTLVPRANFEYYKDLALRQQAELTTLRADLAEAVDVLRKLEWAGDTIGSVSQCRICRGWSDMHHHEDCRLNALLQKAGQP